jgi:hypothetical protein
MAPLAELKPNALQRFSFSGLSSILRWFHAASSRSWPRATSGFAGGFSELVDQPAVHL